MSFDYKRMLHKEVNVGLKEQKIRYGAGAAILLVSVFLGNVFLLLVGAVLLASGFMRWCPVYSGMNKSTVDPNEQPPSAESGGHEH